MKFKISPYVIVLVLFLVVYSFWISSTFDKIQLSYDESRHAAGGMIWHDYIKTIIFDNYVPFDEFVNKYQQMGYNAGWFVNIDPPVDGLIRVPFYLIFGPTFFAIRFMALVCSIISAILVYIIALRITKKEIVALSSAIILLMSTLFYMYSAIQALAPIPIAMMILFWYYFTFVHESKKNYKIKFFKDVYVSFNWNIIIGGLFLTLATLIQYAAAIFIDLFFVIYFIYLILGNYFEKRKEKDYRLNWKIFNESGALQVVFIAFLQNLVFLIISWKWLKYNLFDNHFLERIITTSSQEIRDCTHDLNYLSLKYPWMGRGTSFSNFTYMIHGYLQRTLFFTLFFFYVIYLLIKGKIEDKETRKHIVIISLFFLAIYLYFSLKMSNHQIRYIVHAFPLVIIVSAYGLYYIINLKFKKHQKLIYFLVILTFVVSLFLVDTWMYNKTYQESGEKNDQLLDYLKSKQDFKILLHVPGTGSSETPTPTKSWYYNPDYVMFTFMRAKEGYNPFVFRQQGHLFEYRRDSLEAVDYNAKNLVEQLKGVKNIPIYVVLYRYHESEFYNRWGHNFLENGFSVQNLTYWTVYYKE